MTAGDLGEFYGYLATERNLDWDRNHLGQQAAIESHHEGHRVVIGEHQRHLVDAETESCSLSLAQTVLELARSLQKCQTHPVPRSHHGLLLAAQLVQDVVGKLDAARPQFSCRGQNTKQAGLC